VNAETRYQRCLAILKILKLHTLSLPLPPPYHDHSSRARARVTTSRRSLLPSSPFPSLMAYPSVSRALFHLLVPSSSPPPVTRKTIEVTLVEKKDARRAVDIREFDNARLIGSRRQVAQSLGRETLSSDGPIRRALSDDDTA